MKEQAASLRMGGLGANIGSEEWEKAQKKKEQIASYSEQVRNTVKPVVKPKPPAPREITARDRANQFAKNVPKPKVRPNA